MSISGAGMRLPAFPCGMCWAAALLFPCLPDAAAADSPPPAEIPADWRVQDGVGDGASLKAEVQRVIAELGAPGR